MYVGPRIVTVARFRDGTRVHVMLPDLGDSRMAARLHGMGTYHAVIVSRVSGAASFEFQRGVKKKSPP